ncbi:MAG: eukaryotic-like serine/threonine-protein kinase, partial [Solirubrobacteraceae bacterium]|nr:eukaryotic-like serine/threonine-protein kinase [Solirubrobacteraceae bacterium]
YVLLERLGAGAFGTVWLAHDERLHREVAVKRIARGPREGREDRRRAAREALAAARLSHPAIVGLYEAAADDSAYYLVSEPVRGPSLDELFAAGGPGDRELLRIGAVLADALAHAHARGVVHRDVKPQNVIVPEEVTGGGAPAKLTDFGVALIAGEQPLTRAGDVVGTFAYMAPEQAQGRVVDARADLYSLALTLYEGLAGFNPMRGSTPALTALRQGDPVKPLERSRPDLPRDLSRSIDRALSADPARRGSLVDLRRSLGAALSGDLPAHAHPHPRGRAHRRGGRAPRDRPAPPARLIGPRQPRGVAGLAAFVLVLAALATPLGPASPVSALWAAAAAGVGVGLLPRTGWIGLGATGIGWLVASGEPGAALILALAIAPVPLLLRQAPWEWSAPALGPGLGALGLAIAFPALAGRCADAWQRVALGALGAWWLTLAEPLYGTRLLFGPPPGTLSRAGWEGSVPDAITHAVLPLLGGPVLLLAGVWAAAALVMPWVVPGRAGIGRALGAIAWTTGLVAATGVLGVGAGGPGTGSVLLGAAAAVGLALARSPGRAGAPAGPGVA